MENNLSCFAEDKLVLRNTTLETSRCVCITLPFTLYLPGYCYKNLSIWWVIIILFEQIFLLKNLDLTDNVSVPHHPFVSSVKAMKRGIVVNFI